MVKKYLSLGTESRKIAIGLPIMAFLSLMFYIGKLSEPGYIDFLKWGLVGLFAGLTAEHFAKPQA